MKRKFRSRIGLTVGAALVATALVGVGTEASAEASAASSEIVEAIEAAAGSTGVPVDVRSSSVAADLGTAEVEVPLEPDSGMVIAREGEPAVSIGIPGTSSEPGESEGGGVLFEEVAASTALLARPTTEGVQAIMVIDGPDAPTSYRFPVEIGDGGVAHLVELPGGAIDVRATGSGESIALVTPAWATDARGEPVPTRFEIDGSTLVQIVEHHDATYPVVADPNTCGTVTCTYYFNKKTTKDLASTGSVGLLCGIALKYVPPAGVGCAVAVVSVNVQANRAKNRGMCLKIKYTRFGPTVWWPDIYSGSYCK